jgi:hypothetical protein
MRHAARYPDAFMVPPNLYAVWSRQWDEHRRKLVRQQTVTTLRLEIAKQRVMRALRAREVARVT